MLAGLLALKKPATRNSAFPTSLQHSITPIPNNFLTGAPGNKSKYFKNVPWVSAPLIYYIQIAPVIVKQSDTPLPL
jgi:hypothetical protein